MDNQQKKNTAAANAASKENTATDTSVQKTHLQNNHLQDEKCPAMDNQQKKNTAAANNSVHQSNCTSQADTKIQNKKRHGLFCDKHGNISSKRVAGYILLLAGLAVITIGLLYSREVTQYLTYLFPTAGGLLGVGVLERR